MNGIREIVELNNRAAAAAGYGKWPEPVAATPKKDFVLPLDERLRSRLDTTYKEEWDE